MLNRLSVSVAVMLLFFIWSVFLWKMELGSSGGLHLTKSSVLGNLNREHICV